MQKKQQQFEIPKHLIIDLNDDDSEITPDDSYVKQTTPKKFKNSRQKYQINSIQALRGTMKDNTLVVKQTKNNHIRPYEQSINQLTEQIILSQYQNSQSKSSSINGSMLRFIQEKDARVLQEFDIDLDNHQEKQDSPQKLRKQQTNKQKTSLISLLNPTKQIKSSCYKFLNEIYDVINQNELQKQKDQIKRIHEFVHQLLPTQQNSFMRYVFEIHFYKYTFTFHSCYQFYLRKQNGQMIYLLKSEKDSMSVSSSHIISALNTTNPSQKQFTAKLKYNTAKSEYNLYNIDQKQTPNQPRKFLATAFYSKSLGNDRQITFYRPKNEFTENNFVKTQNAKNLAFFYEESESPVYRKVEKLMSTPISKNQQEQTRKEFSLKNQGRPMLIQNQQGQQQFYMGKRQNQRYIILANGGLSPLQIFTMAIVNLDH